MVIFVSPHARAIKAGAARILTKKVFWWYRMKILHIISDSNVGGAGILLENLLRHSRLRGESVVVLPRGAAMAERYTALGVRVLPLLRSPDRSLSPADLPTLIACLRRERPTVVHTHGSLVGRMAAFFCGVPIRLATRHCAYPVSLPARMLPLRLLRRTADALLTTRTVATAHAAADNLRQLGIPPRKIIMIRNGAEGVAPLSCAARQALRERLGIPRDAFCVGICGRLAPVKGHLTFLSAARILTAQGLRCHFLIVGGGEKEENLREVAERLGLTPRITFTGYTQDPGAYMNLFDVAVNCSTGTETSCLALSEAMSLGIPCVASRFGGNVEMVTEGENGLLFPPRDAGALAAALGRLAQDAALHARLSQGARERFLADCNAQEMANAYDALYTSLLTQRRARPRRLRAVFSKR